MIEYKISIETMHENLYFDQDLEILSLLLIIKDCMITFVSFLVLYSILSPLFDSYRLVFLHCYSIPLMGLEID